jgi:hypothetical protein
VRHARYVIFQMAEVAVPKWLFRAILRRIARLRDPPPVPTGSVRQGFRKPQDRRDPRHRDGLD